MVKIDFLRGFLGVSVPTKHISIHMNFADMVGNEIFEAGNF